MAKESLLKLDDDQFTQTLAVVDREQQANLLTGRQLTLYRRLIELSCTWILCLAVFALGAIIDLLSPVLNVILVIGLGAALASAALVTFNFPLLWKSYRQERLLRKLGLKGLLSAANRDARWWITGALKICVFLAALGFALFAPIVASFMAEGWPYLGAGVAVGCVPLAAYFLWRTKERHQRMTDLAELRASLDRHKAAAAERRESIISIPIQELARIAGIERSQINRQRAYAIAHIEEEEAAALPVVKSEVFAEKERDLEAAVRLKLQAAIDRIATLTSPPRPSPEEILRSEVPETGYFITYSVDCEAGRIEIRDLENGGQAK